MTTGFSFFCFLTFPFCVCRSTPMSDTVFAAPSQGSTTKSHCCTFSKNTSEGGVHLTPRRHGWLLALLQPPCPLAAFRSRAQVALSVCVSSALVVFRIKEESWDCPLDGAALSLFLWPLPKGFSWFLVLLLPSPPHICCVCCYFSLCWERYQCSSVCISLSPCPFPSLFEFHTLPARDPIPSFGDGRVLWKLPRNCWWGKEGK